jgi:hypothetical protein
VSEIAALQSTGSRLILSSDGGQAATGDPFAFRLRALETLREAGFTETDAFTRAAAELLDGARRG